MPQKVFEVTAPDGRIVEITGDTMPTGEQMRKIFASLPPMEAPAQPSSQLETPAAHPLATLGNAVIDAGTGALKGVGETAVGLGELVSKVPGVSHALNAAYGPEVVKGSFDWARSFLKPTNTAQSVGKGIEQVAEIAIPVGGVVKSAISKLPSAARAGRNFQAVMSAARDLPVAITNDVSKAAIRIEELAANGGTMPQSVKKFIAKATSPEGMRYQDARDFLSNFSRLSVRDAQRISPVIRREMGQLAHALGKTVADTAKQAGKLDEYQKAMKEYRQAMKMRDVFDRLAPAAAKGAAGALGAGAAFGAYQKLTGQ